MKLNICGSEFDKIEWNLKSVPPGTIFWKLPPSAIINPVKKIYKKIEVKVPCRLNMTTLDLSAMYLTGQGICKSGSASFGVNLYANAKIELIEEPEIIIEEGTNKPLVAKHVALLLKKELKYKGGFKIKAWDHGYPHVGLGSTPALASAVSNAINLALGKPIDEKYLIKLLAANHLEEGQLKDLLLPSGSIGAGSAIAKYGGLVVISGFGEIVFRKDMPKNCSVFIGLQHKKEAIDSSKSIINPLNKWKHCDRFMAGMVCYWVLMDLMPAVINGDLKKMGDVIWDITLVGTKGIPAIIEQLEDIDRIKILKDLRKNNIELVFMSSLGPGIVAVSNDKNKKKLIESIFKKHSCEIIKTTPNNSGLEIIQKEAYK